MPLIQCQDVKKAFQDAIAIMLINGLNRRRKGEASKRKYSFWPSEIHVSALAYAVTRANPDTVLCALGIGLQIPRPPTPAMQLGTNIHSSLLPIVAKRLNGKYEVPVRLNVEDVQLVGSADLVVDETVIEVKTGKRLVWDEYAKLQVSLYAHLLKCPRQMLVMIDSQTFSVAVAEVEKSPRLDEAIHAIHQYAQMRHQPSVGKCEVCRLFDLCNAYPASRKDAPAVIP